MDIQELRAQIDDIDGQLIQLFVKRMGVSLRVAEYKKQHNLPLYDRGRERQVLAGIAEAAGDDLERYAKALYETIFEVSRNYQQHHLGTESKLRALIEQALKSSPPRFPTRATVAVQGVEGAYSQKACDRMFEFPSILYFKTFDAVFTAVEGGMCRYGVLPIENSAAGSVTQVYDLMEQHKFYIVRGIRQRIDHALLAREGASIGSIKEIVSHQQGLDQCSAFLKDHPGIRATAMENTAVAAKAVADSGRNDLAAIASGDCGALYGLKALDVKVANTDNNFTRFIVISKQFEIFPGSNKIGMTLSLPHQPGSLHRMLARIASAGVNLTKLESRPVAGRDFEFRFHFDVEASLEQPEALALISDIAENSEDFVLLGNYLESY